MKENEVNYQTIRRLYISEYKRIINQLKAKLQDEVNFEWAKAYNNQSLNDLLLKNIILFRQKLEKSTLNSLDEDLEIKELENQKDILFDDVIEKYENVLEKRVLIPRRGLGLLSENLDALNEFQFMNIIEKGKTTKDDANKPIMYEDELTIEAERITQSFSKIIEKKIEQAQNYLNKLEEYAKRDLELNQNSYRNYLQEALNYIETLDSDDLKQYNFVSLKLKGFEATSIIDYIKEKINWDKTFKNISHLQNKLEKRVFEEEKIKTPINITENLVQEIKEELAGKESRVRNLAKESLTENRNWLRFSIDYVKDVENYLDNITTNLNMNENQISSLKEQINWQATLNSISKSQNRINHKYQIFNKNFTIKIKDGQKSYKQTVCLKDYDLISMNEDEVASLIKKAKIKREVSFEKNIEKVYKYHKRTCKLTSLTKICKKNAFLKLIELRIKKTEKTIDRIEQKNGAFTTVQLASTKAYELKDNVKTLKGKVAEYLRVNPGFDEETFKQMKINTLKKVEKVSKAFLKNRETKKEFILTKAFQKANKAVSKLVSATQTLKENVNNFLEKIDLNIAFSKMNKKAVSAGIGLVTGALALTGVLTTKAKNAQVEESEKTRQEVALNEINLPVIDTISDENVKPDVEQEQIQKENTIKDEESEKIELEPLELEFKEEVESENIDTIIPQNDEIEEKEQEFDTINVANYEGLSIIDALDENGYESSMDYRKNLASHYGIEDYHGSPEQNVTLLNMIKENSVPEENVFEEEHIEELQIEEQEPLEENPAEVVNYQVKDNDLSEEEFYSWLAENKKISRAEYDKYINYVLESSNTYGLGISNKEEIYNMEYAVSQIPYEQKVTEVLNKWNLTPYQLDTTVAIIAAEGGGVLDTRGVGNTVLNRSQSSKWGTIGNSIYEIATSGEFTVYEREGVGLYTEYLGKKDNLKYKAAIDYLYLSLMIHDNAFFRSNDYLDSQIYTTPFFTGGNRYDMNESQNVDVSVYKEASDRGRRLIKED